MRRREFIAGLMVAPTMRAAIAQQPAKMKRVAMVHPSRKVDDLTINGPPFYKAFFEELSRLGYVERQNLSVGRYSGEGRTEHYADLARDVVSTHPDLIFAMSGALALPFKSATTMIPIVAMTAHAIKGDRDICLRAGMDAYLSKPVRADELFHAIEGLVAGRSAHSSAVSAISTKNEPFDEREFLARMDGSHEVCVQIAETFLVECPKLMSALRTALRRKDAPELASTAHALKGAISNFTGCTAFHSVVRIEQLAREADLQLAAEVLKLLESDVNALLQSLKSFASAVPKA